MQSPWVKATSISSALFTSVAQARPKVIAKAPVSKNIIAIANLLERRGLCLCVPLKSENVIYDVFFACPARTLF